MTSRTSTSIGWRTLVAAAAVPALLAGCVSKSKYDDALDQNASLQEQVQSQQAQLATQTDQIGQQSAQIGRLQNAIKYTVNSDLLFPPGKWQMSASGRQLIAKLAKQLAPGQQNMVYVSGYTDDAPIGRGAEARRRRLQRGAVAEARRGREELPGVPGLQPAAPHGARATARATRSRRTTPRRGGRRTGAWSFRWRRPRSRRAGARRRSRREGR